MSDNITLPREVGEHLTKILEECPLLPNEDWSERDCAALIALRTALAAEPTKPSGYAYRYADGVLRLNDGSQFNGGWPVEAVPYWFATPALAAPRLEVTVDPRLTPDEAAAISSALAAPAPEPEKRHPGYVIGNHWLETAYSRVCAGEAEADVLRDCGWERVTDAEALRRDAERYRWLLNWLVRTGLLTAQRCRIDAPETYGDWYILKKPYVVDGTALVGYGKTEDAAIDAALRREET